MEIRKLGNTDIDVPTLGLGGATFGREIDQGKSFEVIDYAFDHGIRFFDTAENYGGGNAREYRRDTMQVDDIRETSGEMSSSELTLGRWLKARDVREDVVLCTKMWKPFTPERVATAVANSLDRLQTDVLDVYMIHIWVEDMPLQELLHALSEEVDAGRIRALGCSNFTGAQLTEAMDLSKAHGYARMEAIENNFNLTCREAETDIFPICRAENISFIGFSPLGAGFLTGKYTADKNALPSRSRFDVIPGHCEVYFSDQSFDRLEKLRDLSKRTGHSMVFLAAAWAIASPDVTCTLFGARTTTHLENAVNAAQPAIESALLDEMSAWE